MPYSPSKHVWPAIRTYWVLIICLFSTFALWATCLPVRPQWPLMSIPMSRRLCFYFAFGSMCNPVSMKRRGLVPFESAPALIHGYKLAFQLGGMANLVPDETAVTHGVLHHVTAEMFRVLCKIEATYDIIHVLATPYTPYQRTLITTSGNCTSTTTNSGSSSTNSCCTHAAGSSVLADGSNHSSSNGEVSVLTRRSASSTHSAAGPAAALPGTPGTPVTATAFIVQPEHLQKMRELQANWHDSLPSERYIKIITAGLKHYGADPAWVVAVAAEPYEASKTPDKYLKFPEPEDASTLPTWTVQQLAEYKGKVTDNKVVMACGRKVVQVDMSSKPDAPHTVYLKQHMSGRCNVFGTCMNLYDPSLPPLEAPADIRQEHVDWCEHFSMEWYVKNNFSVRQIGWLEGPLGAAAGTVHGGD